MRLIQLELGSGRAVARVDGAKPAIVPGAKTMLELAQSAIAAKRSLTAEVEGRGAGESFDYTNALAEGRVLPPLDHSDPTHCWITGTGLTHLGSAEARDKMHNKLQGGDENLTDSLKMFKMGLEGGKPKGAGAGVQPEWFYKGDGTALVRPGGAFPMPPSPRMAVRSRRSSASMSSDQTASRSASASRSATSSPITSPSG